MVNAQSKKTRYPVAPQKGNCPYDGHAFDQTTKSVSWSGKTLTFPYPIYFCFYHGFFVWRKDKNVLFELPKFEHEAIDISPLPPEAPDDAYLKCPIKMLKCKFCGSRWRQYITPFFVSDGKFCCPYCDGEQPYNP
jgi:hypothetical protein